MGVGVTELMIVFFISSWMVFFAVAGIGLTSQHEAGDVVSGTDPSAPTNPLIKKKVIWSCIGGGIATILFFIASISGFFGWLAQFSPYASY